MAIPVYLWLKDDGGADIKGSVNVQSREGSVEVVAQDHSVYIPTDNNTGKLTGARVHTPFLFTKEIDASSPYLYKAVGTGQPVLRAVRRHPSVHPDHPDSATDREEPAMERKPQPADSRLRVAEWLAAVQGRVAEASVYRFCQLLEAAAPEQPPLGSSEDPADDLVRFRPDPGMGFPASELKAVEWSSVDQPLPATVRTRLLGLYGLDSPMPTRYLDDIAQKREGHEALEGFLDIFNHRVFTQFYRIWRKYSYPASFAPAGADPTSQCLFGLIGLGIPGTAKRIATPLSRFLALLGVMRLPTRNAEGISALVHLLASRTQASIKPHWPRNIALDAPASLSSARPVSLSQGTPLGCVGRDVNSELLLTLFTADHDEAREWLPGGGLHSDLRVLLQVYLGWRCTARLRLSLPIGCLPVSALGGGGVLLGMTAGLGLQGSAAGINDIITIHLGRYQGLHINPQEREPTHVAYYL